MLVSFSPFSIILLPYPFLKDYDTARRTHERSPQFKASGKQTCFASMAAGTTKVIVAESFTMRKESDNRG